MIQKADKRHIYILTATLTAMPDGYIEMFTLLLDGNNLISYILAIMLYNVGHIHWGFYTNEIPFYHCTHTCDVGSLQCSTLGEAYPATAAESFLNTLSCNALLHSFFLFFFLFFQAQRSAQQKWQNF